MKNNITYKKMLFYFAIFTVIAFLAMRPFLEPLITPEAPNGIISFELAKTLEQSQAMLSSWDNNAKINAGISLGIDYLFLFFYADFFFFRANPKPASPIPNSARVAGSGTGRGSISGSITFVSANLKSL